MPLTRETNDLFAARVVRGGDTEGPLMSDKETKNFADAHGLVFTIGRGENDTAITFWSTFNTNGDEVFHYANAAGNGIISTLVRP